MQLAMICTVRLTMHCRMSEADGVNDAKERDNAHVKNNDIILFFSAISSP
jgi:hypothetical protein